MDAQSRGSPVRRRGAIMIFAAIILVVMFGFVALSVDVGYMTMTKSQLQNAADAAAMAGVRELPQGANAVRLAAKSIALENQAAGGPVSLVDADIVIGEFDFAAKTFTPTGAGANAVKVTTHVEDKPLFFAPVLRHQDFNMAAESIAMLNPRDIVFVVDLSGSMNDDTEPCWATATINTQFAGAGYPTVATTLAQNLYTDLSFGPYPGTYEFVGAPLGVTADWTAYAELTKDDGPLTNSALAANYRISNADDEATRKLKAYRWIIDNQLARLMPAARPVPSSTGSYAYWETYLDYVIDDVWVGQDPPGYVPPAPPPPGPPSPPAPPPPPSPPLGLLDVPSQYQQLFTRSSGPRSLGLVADVRSTVAVELLRASGALAQAPSAPAGTPRRGSTDWVLVPAPKDGAHEIQHFNNPNQQTFPSATANPGDWTNKLGYVTYVQFLLDWGRDRTPGPNDATSAGPGVRTQLSPLGPDCPRHWETTVGGSFLFPPREQPMHAVRRALIAAIDRVRQMNERLTVGYGDNIGIVVYDGLDAQHAPQVIRPLTPDYDAAMLACTDLAAASDIGATTATEAGLILARNHLQLPASGGAGRSFATKVIVLLTDGVPNAWVSTAGSVDSYIAAHPGSDYYAAPYLWYNAPLMQAAKCSTDAVKLHSIGMGLGADYDFLDRMARLAGTAKGGYSVRGSGNPAEYEQRLIEIFDDIVKHPGGRLVD